MMKILGAAILSIVCLGCSGGTDSGAAPAPVKPMTEAEKAALPPQAQSGVNAAQERGNAMAQQYNERYKK